MKVGTGLGGVEESVYEIIVGGRQLEPVSKFECLEFVIDEFGTNG